MQNFMRKKDAVIEFRRLGVFLNALLKDKYKLETQLGECENFIFQQALNLQYLGKLDCNASSLPTSFNRRAPLEVNKTISRSDISKSFLHPNPPLDSWARVAPQRKSATARTLGPRQIKLEQLQNLSKCIVLVPTTQAQVHGSYGNAILVQNFFDFILENLSAIC